MSDCGGYTDEEHEAGLMAEDDRQRRKAAMSDHGKTLKRWINGCREGEEYRVAEAASATMEENARLRETQEQRCIAHAAFNAPDSECVFCDHQAEKERADQAEARLDAALALHVRHSNRFATGRRCWCNWLWDEKTDSCTSPTVKALRGEKP